MKFKDIKIGQCFTSKEKTCEGHILRKCHLSSFISNVKINAISLTEENGDSCFSMKDEDECTIVEVSIEQSPVNEVKPKVKPIKPEDISYEKIIPDLMIEVVNYFIRENIRGKECTIKLKNIRNRYHSLGGDIVEAEKKGYFDFEDEFRKAGWIVNYESPDRGENFEPFFTFKKK